MKYIYLWNSRRYDKKKNNIWKTYDFCLFVCCLSAVCVDGEASMKNVCSDRSQHPRSVAGYSHDLSYNKTVLDILWVQRPHTNNIKNNQPIFVYA